MYAFVHRRCWTHGWYTSVLCLQVACRLERDRLHGMHACCRLQGQCGVIRRQAAWTSGIRVCEDKCCRQASLLRRAEAQVSFCSGTHHSQVTEGPNVER